MSPVEEGGREGGREGGGREVGASSSSQHCVMDRLSINIRGGARKMEAIYKLRDLYEHTC